MVRYRLDLIGPFGFFAPNGQRIEISSQKGMALVALVVAAPGGVRSRRKLESMLWGSRGQKQAQDSLRRELSNLRKVFARHSAGHLLIIETKRVALAIDQIDVDVFGLGLRPVDLLERKYADFLEGIDLPDCDEFEDWLREERERVAAMFELAIPERAAFPSATEVLGEAAPRAEEALVASEPRMPPKPSVVVLPFEVPDDETGGAFGAGLADEVSVCLSAFPQLFIVSSSAGRAIAGLGLARPEMGRQLGVRYLLEGTVMRSGHRLRVSVALVEAAGSEQIWAESFTGEADESFTLQSEIAERIAPQIWTKVDHQERKRGLRLIGSVSGDYERYWRANALSRSWDRDSIAEAIGLTMELVERDPTCPWATSLAAYCHSVAWMLNHNPDREAMLRRSIRNYQAALRYGSDNVEALGYCAATLINIRGDVEMADRIIGTALHILPAHQPALFWGGWVDVVRGEPERATERFELALRINPVSGVQGQTWAGLGYAALQLGDPQRALRLLLEANRATPDFPPTLLGLCVAAQVGGEESMAQNMAPALIAGGATSLIDMLRRAEDRALFTQALEAAAN